MESPLRYQSTVLVSLMRERLKAFFEVDKDDDRGIPVPLWVVWQCSLAGQGLVTT